MKVMETSAQYGELLLKGQEDIEWYNAHFSELVKRFNDKFVAIENQEIIEADAGLDTLLDKLIERGIDPSEILIKFVSKARIIL